MTDIRLIIVTWLLEFAMFVSPGVYKRMLADCIKAYLMDVIGMRSTL